MSDDYHYENPKPLEEEEIEETLEDKFRKMTDEQFVIFYRFLLKKLGVNRHANPYIQVWSVLSVDRYVIAKVLAEVERMEQ